MLIGRTPCEIGLESFVGSMNLVYILSLAAMLTGHQSELIVKGRSNALPPRNDATYDRDCRCLEHGPIGAERDTRFLGNTSNESVFPEKNSRWPGHTDAHG